MIYSYKKIKVYYNLFNETYRETIPILFLHGWGMNGSCFNYFCKNLPSKMCITIDFPPFGYSKEPKTSLNLQDYTDIIVRLLKKLNLQKVDIVAHSFGGRIAIQLSSTTNYVNKLLLTGSAGIKNKSFKKFLKVKKFKFLKFLAKIRLFPYKKLNNYGSKDYKNLSPIMKETFKNIVNYDQTYLLSKISAPTLLIWGRLDKETPFYFTKIFKKHIKDCEVIAFEKCSHFAFLEKPQLFLNIIKSFC